MPIRISDDLIATQNARLEPALTEDFSALGRQLARRGIDIETVTARAMGFSVAIPSWGVGTGGTRFARFPGDGEPRGIVDKLDDCAVIQALTRVTPRVSPHFPWDETDADDLRAEAAARGLAFDAVNSNTFQDQPGQSLSYKFGSLSHTDRAVRAQAIAHNIACMALGSRIGSSALTVWIGDGSNFPGQSNIAKAFDRYIESMQEIVAAAPEHFEIFIEHKFYEPAFYSTVLSDWGSSFMAAQLLGPKVKCLVDLGHHAPNVNIEQIVARLARFGKLAGFHFNDSKYGDDDLDTGSVDPFRLFLIFNELADAELRVGAAFRPAYMIDQSHNVTDPIESLMQSAIEIARAATCVALVDRAALEEAQERNDALGAHRLLKAAYLTDVSPILAEARRRSGGAIDPIETYRAAGYRARVAGLRPAAQGSGGGIV